MQMCLLQEWTMFREIIEIRDGFKECCILSKEGVSDIIENLTVF